MRSWLFAPGHDRRKLSKALASEADVVIVDWEDGVPDDQRAAAHALARELLPGNDGHAPRIVVRTQCGADPRFEQDLKLLQQLLAEGAPVSGIVLPKVEDAAEVRAAAKLGVPVIVSVESAFALEHTPFLPPDPAEGPSGNPGQIERLVLGSLDLLTDFGLPWQPEQPLLAYARARLAVISRAAGLQPPIDGVFPPLDDAAGFESDAGVARSMGFGGKMLIHPSQIRPANDTFGRGADELERARRVRAAYEEANDRGAGIAVVDGQMIDAPVVAWARNVLAED